MPDDFCFGNMKQLVAINQLWLENSSINSKFGHQVLSWPFWSDWPLLCASWNYFSLTPKVPPREAGASKNLKVKLFWFEIILQKLGFRIILVMQKLQRKREYNWKVWLVPALLQHVSFTFWLKQIFDNIGREKNNFTTIGTPKRQKRC